MGQYSMDHSRTRSRIISCTRSAALTGLFTLIAFVAFSGMAAAASFHVTATGSSSGTGSAGSPWDLQTALNHPAAVHPGDTIWVHGGTYAISGASYSSVLQGTAAKPIVVRNYKDERATLTNDDLRDLFYARSNYTWYWGLEFTSSHTPPLVSEYGGSLVILGGSGEQPTVGNRFINCVLHDAMVSGFGDWVETNGTVIYGCLAYFNGRKIYNDNYGYGIYGQNDPGSGYKHYEDNFLLHNFGGYQIHLYTEAAYVDSFHVAHNIISSTVMGASILVSKQGVANGLMLDSNYFYGYNENSTLYVERKALGSPIVLGNMFMRGILSFRATTTDRVFQGNVNYGGWPQLTSGTSSSNWDTTGSGAGGNSWLISTGTPPRPQGGTAIVRRNRYDARRLHVVLYNWSGADAMQVDLSAYLQVGATYTVRDAQNYYGTPVMSGTYTGGKLTFPLANLPVATPVTAPPALGAPAHTSKEFGTFILTTSAAAADPIGQAPEIIAPTVGGSASGSTMDVRWKRIAGATAYQVQVTNDSTWAKTLIDSTATDTCMTVSVASAYKKYFVRVRGKNGTEFGPYSSSVWVTYDPGKTAVDDPGAVAREYRLDQNYPNPFNPSTSIAFDLPRAGYTTLKVYDIAGREVAVVCAADLPAGRTVVQWDASARGEGEGVHPALASGMYIYRIRSGAFTASRKMMLVR